MNLLNTIIYLIGVPAVGKYTVAKEIGRMTGAKVVDNQLINFPVYSVIGYDGTANFPFPHSDEIKYRSSNCAPMGQRPSAWRRCFGSGLRTWSANLGSSGR